MKKLLLFATMALGIGSAHAGDTDGTYKPLLEDGKAWRYTYVLNSFYQYPEYFEGVADLKGENLVDLKIQGKTEIDGQEYYNLYYYDAYAGNDPYRFCNDVPFAFMREDIAEGKVWVVLNTDPFTGVDDYQTYNSYVQHYLYFDSEKGEYNINGPVLAYDFRNLENGLVTKGCAVGDKSEFENSGTEYVGTRITNFNGSEYTLVEGLGLICGEKIHYPNADVLGFVGYAKSEFPSDEPLPYLYEVRNGAGEVIYSDGNHAPGWAKPAFSGIKDACQAPQVKVIGDEVRVCADGILSVYNAQGQLIGRHKASDGIVTFSTDNYPKGVYLLTTGAMSAKFAK